MKLSAAAAAAAAAVQVDAVASAPDPAVDEAGGVEDELGEDVEDDMNAGLETADMCCWGWVVAEVLIETGDTDISSAILVSWQRVVPKFTNSLQMYQQKLETEIKKWFENRNVHES